MVVLNADKWSHDRSVENFEIFVQILCDERSVLVYFNCILSSLKISFSLCLYVDTSTVCMLFSTDISHLLYCHVIK